MSNTKPPAPRARAAQQAAVRAAREIMDDDRCSSPLRLLAANLVQADEQFERYREMLGITYRVFRATLQLEHLSQAPPAEEQDDGKA